MVTNPPEPTAIPGGAPTPPVGLPIPAATDRHEPVRRPMIRTFHHEDFAAADLAALKARHGHRVSVCLPARDEAATVGVIVERLRKSLVEDVDLVDEVLVVDDHSTDRTAELAATAGARAVAVDDVLPELGGGEGKGERSEERRVGQRGVSTCRSRWQQHHSKTTIHSKTN